MHVKEQQCHGMNIINCQTLTLVVHDEVGVKGLQLAEGNQLDQLSLGVLV